MGGPGHRQANSPQDGHMGIPMILIGGICTHEQEFQAQPDAGLSDLFTREDRSVREQSKAHREGGMRRPGHRQADSIENGPVRVQNLLHSIPVEAEVLMKYGFQLVHQATCNSPHALLQHTPRGL